MSRTVAFGIVGGYGALGIDTGQRRYYCIFDD